MPIFNFDYDRLSGVFSRTYSKTFSFISFNDVLDAPLNVYTQNTFLANYNDPIIRGEIEEETGKGIGLIRTFFKKTVNWIAPETDPVAFYQEVRWVERTATESLQRGRGVCTDRAILFVSFLRGANIPSRVIEGRFEGAAHSWVEVFINGEWVLVDPSNGRLDFDDWLKEKGKEQALNYSQQRISNLNSPDPFILGTQLF